MTCNYPVSPFEGFSIIDLTDPTSPTLRGHYPLQNPVGGLAIRDSWAFVTDATGLHVFDISKPDKPTLKTTWATSKPAVHIRDNGARSVLVAPGGIGLTMLDLTNPASPTGKGSCKVAPEKLATIALSGSLALTDSPTCGLQIYDISNPHFPAFKGALDAITQAVDLKTSGILAFAVGADGLQIADFSNPVSPVLKSTYPVGQSSKRLRLRGRQVLLPDYSKGLKIIDLTDPTSPTLLGACDTPGWAHDVDTTGSYAYVTDWNSLQVMDITDPAKPRILANVATPDSYTYLGLWGTKAFVAGSHLTIFDLAAPRSPQAKYVSDTPSTYWDLFLSYPRLFSCTNAFASGYTIQMHDITNPDAPVLKFSEDIYSNRGTRLFCTDPYLYTADSGNGVKIFRVREGPRPSQAGEGWGMYP